MKTHANRLKFILQEIHRLVGIEYTVCSLARTGVFQLYLRSPKPSEICRIDLIVECLGPEPDGNLRIHPGRVLRAAPGPMPLSDLVAILQVLDGARPCTVSFPEFLAVHRDLSLISRLVS